MPGEHPIGLALDIDLGHLVAQRGDHPPRLSGAHRPPAREVVAGDRSERAQIPPRDIPQPGVLLDRLDAGG
jgi:hypothetical protein